MSQTSGLFSCVLPVSAIEWLAHRDFFWSTVHDHGQLVDALPGFNPEILDALLDFLSTNLGIGVPGSFGQQFLICPPPGVKIFGLCTRHDLRVLHARIKKMGTHDFSTSFILKNYGSDFPGSFQLEQDYIGFLAGQWKNLENEDSASLLRCVDEL